MLTNIAMEMRQKPDWLVIELNPMRDLLQSLAAKIYSIPELHAKFLNNCASHSRYFSLQIKSQY